jgi:hypothetical protein
MKVFLMSAEKLLLVAVMAVMAVMMVSCKPKSTSNLVTYSIPEEAVRCFAGDYVITNIGTNRCKVVRIEKVALVSPLVPITADASHFVEQMSLQAGNTIPEGWGEIHLIVTSFHREYPTQEQAINAIKANELGDWVEGLCKNAKLFLKVNSKVYKTSPSI